MENTLFSQKKGKYYHRGGKITLYFQLFIIKLRNCIIPFKLTRLLVTHDSGKLTRVGELSLTERLQDRLRVTLAVGNLSTQVGRVTLALG